eukprot:2603468-Rhodomonas_salina.1
MPLSPRASASSSTCQCLQVQVCFHWHHSAGTCRNFESHTGTARALRLSAQCGLSLRGAASSLLSAHRLGLGA